MKVDAVAFSFAGDKYLGRPYSEMDCQAFVERCMKDCGLNMNLAGSNAWYREVRNNGWVGSPEECKRVFGQIPKGALLFILKHDGNEPAKYRPDGLGNANHIGFKTGRNEGAINSSSSKGCVAVSKFKDKTIRGGWNTVGLYNKFDYGKAINEKLEHGEDVKTPMQGKVTAQTGATVNLRKSPDGDLIERIPIGTKVTIIEYGPEWCKVIVGGLTTGYMMTKFIDIEGEVVPGEDDFIKPGPTDVEEDDDFGSSDAYPETLQLSLSYEDCANAYPLLRALCDMIEAKIGRG